MCGGQEDDQMHLSPLDAVTMYMRVLESRMGFSEAGRSIADIWSGRGGIDAEVLSGALFHRYFSIAAQTLVGQIAPPYRRLLAYQEIESATRTAISTTLNHTATAPEHPLAIAIATAWRATASEQLTEELVLILQNHGRT